MNTGYDFSIICVFNCRMDDVNYRPSPIEDMRIDSFSMSKV